MVADPGELDALIPAGVERGDDAFKLFGFGPEPLGLLPVAFRLVPFVGQIVHLVFESMAFVLVGEERQRAEQTQDEGAADGVAEHPELPL